MSKIHILEYINRDTVHVVIHIPIPSGNNLSGISWKEVGLNSGKTGKTILVEGINAGQITTVEKTSIINGDVVEIVSNIEIESGGATANLIRELVNKEIDIYMSKTKQELKYYGLTLN